MQVPLLDLKPQYQSIRDALDAALLRVAESQGFILGPEVEALEAELAEFLNVPYAIGCASGTDALLLPLKALDPEPGDEVVIPAFTFFATAGAVWNAGFRPVFCDVDPDTFNVRRETLEAAWTPRTRAIIPVHLFGQMAPMADILELAQARGAVVIEDCAQSIGAAQRLAGPHAREGWVQSGAAGDMGSFSFFPTKNLGGFGDGGLVTVRDSAELADRVGKLRVHGGKQMYHHEMVGTNSRLDALQAAVLRIKLPHLPEWTEKRRENACMYHGGLADLPRVQLPVVADGNKHVYNQFTIRTPDRDALRSHLSEKGIGTGIYYPVPLHLQPCFAELGGKTGDLPVSEMACKEVLSLPIFPELGADRLQRVIDEIRAFYHVQGS